MQFSGRFLYSMIQFANSQGANIQDLVRISELPVERLLQEDCMVESSCYNKVIQNAMEMTGDQHFGLHAGEQMSLAGAGLVGQITQSSPTIKKAIEYSCEYISLGCRAIPKKLEFTGDHYRLTLSPVTPWINQNPEVVRQTADGIVVFTIREFQSLSFRKRAPVRVEFNYPRPGDISEYKRIFPCELVFGQKQTAILFEKTDIETPVISSDFKLLRVLVEHANQKLLQMRQAQEFHQIVRKTILNLLDPGFPTINQVAANLNLSVRTLQRKLKSDGLVFKEILEELRKEMAINYIENGDFQINEIAHLLNYADASTFIRSFKKWTGKTPTGYRTSVKP